MGEKNDLAEQLDNSAGEGTHDALCQSPAEEVMADNEGENQIVHKLADSCGNVGSAGIDAKPWSFLMVLPMYQFTKLFTTAETKEGDRASEKHIPGSAEGVVQGGVYDCFGPVYIGFAPGSRDQAAEIEDQTHPEIDGDGDHAEHRGRFGPETPGDHVHAQEDDP